MCGIAGIFAYHYAAAPIDRSEVRVIRDHMTARGPDGRGEWFSTDGRVALGHRRLSIIDLSDRAAQPMVSADGQLIISFNGEIYNYRQLKTELEAKGRVFRTESDTEVLLHLYAEKGEAMLHELRGMFAFALWDARKQALLLARDQFGIKPLYYTSASTSAGTLRFASQVKALLAGGQIDTAPEPAGHTGFFLWGSVPAPYTLYRGIRALPAGHFLWVGAQGASEPQPFCLITDILAHAAANPARGSQRDALDAIGAAVRSSIAAHHVADVPVGMFLSAGFDSALITALSSAHGERPHTLTLAFAEYVGTPNDESPPGRATGGAAGHPSCHRDGAQGRLRGAARAPAGRHGPAQHRRREHLVCLAGRRLARHQGGAVRPGSDELFASYSSFAKVPRITSH